MTYLQVDNCERMMKSAVLKICSKTQKTSKFNNNHDDAKSESIHIQYLSETSESNNIHIYHFVSIILTN